MYEGEVRVARIGEDTRIRENGRWVSTSQCLKLEVFDVLEARFEIVEAIENSAGISATIPPGIRCQFLGWDDDGDVVLRRGLRRTVFFFEDLDRMTIV